MQLPISQLLREASEIQPRSEKLRYLRSHRTNTAMMFTLRFAFDPVLKWNIQKGTPPFTALQEANASSYYRQSKKLTRFLKGTMSPTVKPAQLENLFIGMLESILPADAEMICAVKDGTLTKMYKGVDKKLIREAFPMLLSAEPIKAPKGSTTAGLAKKVS